ncbi:hypothetical protein D4A35_03080 [Paraclostridium bifermentans]|uniref:Uncharacterized protein n=1 Tax=Paraclostridium bifermentans TaxID=1490 RepID=A0A5P3XD38_PARBF|nr:hypothetical protein [Paraclostridium bifermentans]QEZ67965.1 hypothetical protein D4A35_03080 [Paraclostridium bifermentans]
MGELDFTETRFKCYREMAAINIYIREFEKESEEYKDVLHGIRSFTDEGRQSVFNKLKINKANNINSKEFLSRYREFEQFKDINNKDIYTIFDNCEKYLDKEYRYIKMHLVYMYTILDECLLELLNALEINSFKLSGILSKLDAILKSPKIETQIDKETSKKLYVFNRIRNDIIHNNGKVNENTIKKAKKKPYYMNDLELEETFNLFEGKEINLKIGDLKQYSDISNDILKKLYIAFMTNN